MSRRNGRILAFQALYSWDVNKAPLDELLTFSWAGKQNDENAIEPVMANNAEENPYKQEEMTFATLLASGTINHIDENKMNNLVSNLEWCSRRTNLLKYKENKYHKKYLT